MAGAHAAAADPDALADEAGATEPTPKKKGRSKLVLLLVALVLLGGAGAGLWFTGILPGLLGLGHAEEGSAAESPARPPGPPVFVELPEIIVNLNVSGRRPSYLKLRARLEVPSPADSEAAQRMMPRLIDLFTTYLRELRPEELRGSLGTWRLREELRARASLAVAPARIADVLFQDMLVQ